MDFEIYDTGTVNCSIVCNKLQVWLYSGVLCFTQTTRTEVAYLKANCTRNFRLFYMFNEKDKSFNPGVKYNIYTYLSQPRHRHKHTTYTNKSTHSGSSYNHTLSTQLGDDQRYIVTLEITPSQLLSQTHRGKPYTTHTTYMIIRGTKQVAVQVGVP